MTEHSGRFAITPARAVEDHRLGDAAYRLLACLGTYADKDGWCWPSMPTLADRLGKTRQAVQRSIRQLAEIGYLEVEPRRRPDGSQDRNRYRLLFDRALFEVRDRAAEKVGQHDVAGGNLMLRDRNMEGRGTATWAIPLIMMNVPTSTIQ